MIRKLFIVVVLTGMMTSADASRQRIISLGSAVTETLISLGVGDQIVGIDNQSPEPATKQAIFRLGYIRTLSPESLISLNPSRVIATDEAGPSSTIDRLRILSLSPLLLKPTYTLQGTKDFIDRIAEATNTEPQAEMLKRQVEKQFQNAKSYIQKNHQSTRVLMLLQLSANQNYILGKNTNADQWLQKLSVTNAADKVVGMKLLNPEALLSMDADKIIIFNVGHDQPSQTLQSVLDFLQHDKQTKLLNMPAETLNRYGIDFPKTINQLAHCILGNICHDFA